MPETSSISPYSSTKEIEEISEPQEGIHQTYKQKQFQYSMSSRTCPTEKLKEDIVKTKTPPNFNMYLMSHSADWVHLRVCVIISRNTSEIGNAVKSTQLNGTLMESRNETLMSENRCDSATILECNDIYEIDIKKQVTYLEF